MTEILSPAGGYEALVAAVSAGADAVYLGGASFSARSFAKNFTNEELEAAVSYCHLRGVKVYAAVNTLISDREMKEAEKYIRFLNRIGVDGIIVQDLGLIELIKSVTPSMPIHASTQMTIIDEHGALLMKESGLPRVVLARELSYDKIRHIKETTKMEIEAFVHGAICVCYSGQCLMSSFIGGRSGNRGSCAQPCRLEYKTNKAKGFLMSPKDMCLVRHIDKLKSAGIDSLKIEGRMKGPDYVGTVTSVYRKYIDSPSSVTDEDYKKLENAFFRGGFTDRYFTGNKSHDMLCINKPDNPYERQKKTEIPVYEKKRGINIFFELKCGEPVNISITTDGGIYASFSGEVIAEKAENRPLTKDRITEQLSKLGGTVFTAESIEITLDEGITLPVSEINRCRRECIALLEKEIINHCRRYDEQKFIPFEINHTKEPFTISVRVSDKKQLEAVRSLGCEKIYAPLDIAGENEVAILPRITPDDIKDKLKNVKRALATNIGQVRILKSMGIEFTADYTLNLFNTNAVKFIADKGAERAIVSCELMLSQIRDIKSELPLGAVVYGRIPLMITENCLVNTDGNCTKGGILTDRMGEKFPVRCVEGCRNEILNSKPVIMSDKANELKDVLSEGVLYFTTETPEECKAIYKAYTEGKPIGGEFTRGKFYKGV